MFQKWWCNYAVRNRLELAWWQKKKKKTVSVFDCGKSKHNFKIIWSKLRRSHLDNMCRRKNILNFKNVCIESYNYPLLPSVEVRDIVSQNVPYVNCANHCQDLYRKIQYEVVCLLDEKKKHWELISQK